MKDFLDEFKAFVNRGNLVELAVAFTMTLFFVPVVNAIVDGLIMQLTAGSSASRASTRSSSTSATPSSRSER